MTWEDLRNSPVVSMVVVLKRVATNLRKQNKNEKEKKENTLALPCF